MNMQNKRIPLLNSTDIFNADCSFALPVQLQLNELGETVYCDLLLRIVPGKRLVLAGVWHNKEVVAKIFFAAKHAKRHYERELNGLTVLSASGVPTPAILYQGLLTSYQPQSIYILLFEKIIASHHLEHLWHETGEPNKLTPLLKRMTIELATQHVLGVLQQDLHLRNFIITDKKIYTLDGDTVDYFQNPLPKKTSLTHLALFISQLGAGTQQLQHLLLTHYAAARGWRLNQWHHLFLQQAVKKWHASRLRQYQKKLLRNSTAFIKMANAGATIMYDRSYHSPELLELLKNPDSAFMQPGIEYLKMGHSSTVAKIMLAGEPCVIKRYNITSATHGLRRCLRPTRARRSWLVGHILRLFNIATPKPIAFIEKQLLGLKGKSYLIMQYNPNLDIAKNWAKANTQTQLKILSSMKILFAKLTEMRISHGDLKAPNILWSDKGPVLIDLDGVTLHQNQHSFQRARKKDQQRFLKNWQDTQATQTEFAELFKL
jgi:tRNA A-37 threonylcarbamoyl transferase component Bud32